eukprot:snap_masked-scaffold_40-processed-gene-2.5-mRNA-1 protein AED:1.00 eAED:1.00 QI:0/0/0/0/1/1/2/0/70
MLFSALLFLVASVMLAFTLFSEKFPLIFQQALFPKPGAAHVFRDTADILLMKYVIGYIDEAGRNKKAPLE